MTAQIYESLHYQGENLPLCTNPLDSYFAFGGARPDFADTSTALWRGYVGRWDIVDGRLYMVGLSATLVDGRPATLDTVFPGCGARVFAHWYTGTLRVPQGRQLKYVHMGYGSVHERDLLIDVVRGVVTGTRWRVNGVADGEGGPQGWGMAAFTEMQVHKGPDAPRGGDGS
jgi:hypothetical protein